MSIPRMPVDAWRQGLLLAAVFVLPIGSVLALVPASRELEQLAVLVAFVGGLGVLAAGSLLYLYWRLSADPGWGWLVTAGIFGGTQVVTGTGLALSDRADEGSRPGWLLLTELTTASIILLMVLHSRRARRCWDPLAAGLTVGILFAPVRVLISWVPPPLGVTGTTLVLLSAATLVVYALATALVATHRSLPDRAAIRLAVGVSLFTASHVLSIPGGPQGPLLHVFVICSGLAAALVLVDTCFSLLRAALAAQEHSVDGLHEKLEEVEARERYDRERLHEIRSTLAGIAEASRLLHAHDQNGLDEAGRLRLEHMLESEMARLERLLDRRGPDVPAPVDLDTTLDPLLEAHRVRGHRVEWRPSGHTVHGRADDVAEAVNILLDNAAKHAGDGVSRIAVHDRDDAITIEVIDSGPGIPPDMRDRIFEWGVRGNGSSGQGIGLNLARRLVSEQGGTLQLSTPNGAGTSFVITLPAARISEENDDPVQHPAAQ